MSSTTRWEFEFDAEVRTGRGEHGKIVGRSEIKSDGGMVSQRYQIENRDDAWGEVTRIWAPSHAIYRV